MIHTALSSAALIGSPYASILESATKAGVHGIEWSYDSGLEPGNIAQAEDLMMATLRAGLSTASYASLFRVGVHSGEAFSALLATARALHAPIIRLWAGDKSPSPERDAEDFASSVRILADRAADEGVTLCLGMGRGSALDSYERARLLLEAADHPFVKLCWEPLPGSSFDGAMEAFSSLVGRVGILCARSSGKRSENILLRDKAEDWLLYLDAFDEQGGAPDMARYVVIRSFKDGRPESLADDVRLVRHWAEKLRRYRRRRLL